MKSEIKSDFEIDRKSEIERKSEIVGNSEIERKSEIGKKSFLCNILSSITRKCGTLKFRAKEWLPYLWQNYFVCFSKSIFKIRFFFFFFFLRQLLFLFIFIPLTSTFCSRYYYYSTQTHPFVRPSNDKLVTNWTIKVIIPY